jgi:hypothetical protein
MDPIQRPILLIQMKKPERCEKAISNIFRTARRRRDLEQSIIQNCDIKRYSATGWYLKKIT